MTLCLGCPKLHPMDTKQRKKPNRAADSLYMHPLRVVWSSMRTRCNNPNSKSYKNYGAIGITVCDRWNSLKNFIEDMPPRPSLRHSMDRIDNSKGYEPGNVRWATKAEQHRNYRKNRLITIDGETLCLTDWAIKSGVSRDVLKGRIVILGWEPKRAISTPVRSYQK